MDGCHVQRVEMFDAEWGDAYHSEGRHVTIIFEQCILGYNSNVCVLTLVLVAGFL